MDDAVFGASSEPARWLVYFGADDADEMVTRAQALGGTVVRAPEDTPYGRLASVTDVTGAVFNVMAPNEAMPLTREAATAVTAG
jgi:predicted enzyme related to lactoylglutathione lyase